MDGRKTIGRGSNPRSTGSLDLHFGEKLRARRLMTHVSQQDLAKVLGLSFQQIQKYEKGTNRTSAAMLLRIAAVLKLDVVYFHEGLPRSKKNSKGIKTPILIKMPLAAHGPRLMDAFPELKSDKPRGAVADLAQVLTNSTMRRPRPPPWGEGFGLSVINWVLASGYASVKQKFSLPRDRATPLPKIHASHAACQD
jgi:transcriptional regulator with XRE-family HTH domain